MSQVINRPVQWNKERDNLEFNLRREVKMLAEELYEMCGYSRHESKELSEEFVEENIDMHFDTVYGIPEDFPSDDSIIDAAGDLLFIAAGTIGKMGLVPSEILERICNHNDAKGTKKDADGKIIKDETFVEPVHVPDLHLGCQNWPNCEEEGCGPKNWMDD